MKSMRRDNRGVSLVEIMIVIAIIAVLGGVGIMSFNAITGKPAQQCAQKIVYSLERHRTSAMSKVYSQYKLYVGADKKIYLQEFVSNTDPSAAMDPAELGAAGIEVKYECVDSSGNVVVRDLETNPLVLSFDRGSGAFKKLGAEDLYCQKIMVSRGGRTYEVTLVPLTGKVYID